MLSPDDIRQLIQRRYRRRRRDWLVEGLVKGLGGAIGGDLDAAAAAADWPWTLAIGAVTEQDFASDPAQVRGQVEAWQRERWPAGVSVNWVERAWPRFGRQSLPQGVVVDSPDAVAAVVGDSERWATACQRASAIAAIWPSLARGAVLGRLFDPLADWATDDIERLVGLLRWAQAHPASGLYLRQLPVPGLDTKWIAARTAVVTELLRALREPVDRREQGVEAGSDTDADEGDGQSLVTRPGASSADLHDLLGLRRAPIRLRVRILCPALRAAVGGLVDIEAPVAELAALAIRPRAVLIVENLETGLALPDCPGVVALMKLGAAVKLAAHLPWIVGASRTWYWGDIDSHGFEILNRARSVLPKIESVLMTQRLLLTHRDLCVVEPTPSAVAALPLLSAAEREVFDGLRSQRWGTQLRLEQERIPWQVAVQELQSRLAGDAGDFKRD
jgi:hypothetical protein